MTAMDWIGLVTILGFLIILHDCNGFKYSDLNDLNFTLDYDNLRFDWVSLIDRHNRKYFWNYTENIYEKTLFGSHNYHTESYAHLLKPVMIPSGMLVDGSWDKLRYRFFHKLRQSLATKIRKHNSAKSNGLSMVREVTFNVLITGGSVPSGHGCLTMDPQFILNNHTITEDEHEGAQRWCSWPRRFVEMFQWAINRLTHSFDQNPLIKVSPRFCTSGGCSTVCMVENQKAREYNQYHCFNNIDSYNWPEVLSESWEPDLVLWDHSVNDNNSKFFRQMSRKVAYRSFIDYFRSLPSQPQILTLSLQHGYQKDQGAEKERVEENSKHEIPYFAYDIMFERLNNKIVENTPFHAADYAEHHAAFPTHAIWAQIAVYLIVNPTVLPADGLIKYSSNSPRVDTTVDFSGDSQFCRQGFSTRYDFGGGVAVKHLIRGKSQDSEEPIARVGSWSLGTDNSRRIDASGWVFVSDSFSANVSNMNIISFRCHEPILGDVEISYLASYTQAWGEAVVNVSTFVESKDKQVNKMIVSPPTYINSKWNLSFSIQQDQEIPSIWKEKSESVMTSIRYVDISIRVVRGDRFKLIAVSCC